VAAAQTKRVPKRNAAFAEYVLSVRAARRRHHAGGFCDLDQKTATVREGSTRHFGFLDMRAHFCAFAHFCAQVPGRPTRGGGWEEFEYEEGAGEQPWRGGGGGGGRSDEEAGGSGGGGGGGAGAGSGADDSDSDDGRARTAHTPPPRAAAPHASNGGGGNAGAAAGAAAGGNGHDAPNNDDAGCERPSRLTLHPPHSLIHSPCFVPITHSLTHTHHHLPRTCVLRAQPPPRAVG
jgi:hypothetical protein